MLALDEPLDDPAESGLRNRVIVPRHPIRIVRLVADCGNFLVIFWPLPTSTCISQRNSLVYYLYIDRGQGWWLVGQYTDRKQAAFIAADYRRQGIRAKIKTDG